MIPSTGIIRHFLCAGHEAQNFNLSFQFILEVIPRSLLLLQVYKLRLRTREVKELAQSHRVIKCRYSFLQRPEWFLNSLSPLPVYVMPLQHAFFIRTGPEVVKAWPTPSQAELGQDILQQSHHWTSPRPGIELGLPGSQGYPDLLSSWVPTKTPSLPHARRGRVHSAEESSFLSLLDYKHHTSANLSQQAGWSTGWESSHIQAVCSEESGEPLNSRSVTWKQEWAWLCDSGRTGINHHHWALVSFCVKWGRFQPALPHQPR